MLFLFLRFYFNFPPKKNKFLSRKKKNKKPRFVVNQKDPIFFFFLYPFFFNFSILLSSIVMCLYMLRIKKKSEKGIVAVKCGYCGRSFDRDVKWHLCNLENTTTCNCCFSFALCCSSRRQVKNKIKLILFFSF